MDLVQRPSRPQNSEPKLLTLVDLIKKVFFLVAVGVQQRDASDLQRLTQVRTRFRQMCVGAHLHFLNESADLIAQIPARHHRPAA